MFGRGCRIATGEDFHRFSGRGFGGSPFKCSASRRSYGSIVVSVLEGLSHDTRAVALGFLSRRRAVENCAVASWGLRPGPRRGLAWEPRSAASVKAVSDAGVYAVALIRVRC